MLQIGDMIKNLRIKNEYTQSQLADMLGIQLTTMQKYESGAIKNVKLETLQKLCQIFDAPASTFVFPNTNEEEKFWLLRCAIIRYSGLNDEGIQKAICYMEDLQKIDDYAVQDEVEN